MSCAIQNNSGPKYNALKPLITDFYPYAKEKMGFDRDASIFLRSDPENAKDPLGKTAYYSPSEFKIVVFTDNRHPKDILRSISHELVHHAQNCRGDFKEMGEIGEGYAQNNPHLRKMEEEAYRLGSGIYFRDWTDHLKEGDRIMKEWKETKNRGFGEGKPAKDEFSKKSVCAKCAKAGKKACSCGHKKKSVCAGVIDAELELEIDVKGLKLDEEEDLIEEIENFLTETTFLKENKSKMTKKRLKIRRKIHKKPPNTQKIEEKKLDQAFAERNNRLNRALIQRWIRK